DVAAAHPLHGHDLAGQPRAGDVVPRHLRAQHLDRDQPVLGVYGLIHDPHAAVADAPTDLVRADVLRQLLTVGETCRHCHSDLIPSNTAWCSLSAGIPRTRAVMPDCSGAVTAQARRHSFSVTPD